MVRGLCEAAGCCDFAAPGAAAGAVWLLAPQAAVARVTEARTPANEAAARRRRMYPLLVFVLRMALSSWSVPDAPADGRTLAGGPGDVRRLDDTRRPAGLVSAGEQNARQVGHTIGTSPHGGDRPHRPDRPRRIPMTRLRSRSRIVRRLAAPVLLTAFAL